MISDDKMTEWVKGVRTEFSDLRETLSDQLTGWQLTLNKQADYAGRIHPLMEVTSRVKTTSSILAKLRDPAKQQLAGVSLEGLDNQDDFLSAVFAVVPDVLGFRLLCPTTASVFYVVEALKERLAGAGYTNIAALERNYVAPRPEDADPADVAEFAADSKEVQRNYHSYHFTVQAPAHGTLGLVLPVEIQVRTYGMHFYAQIEHEIHYKGEEPLIADRAAAVEAGLTKIAPEIYALDDKFSQIYEGYLAAKETQFSLVLAVSDNKWGVSVLDAGDQRIDQFGGTGDADVSHIQAELIAAAAAVDWCREKGLADPAARTFSIYYGWDKIADLAEKRAKPSASTRSYVTVLQAALAEADRTRITILWRWLDEHYTPKQIAAYRKIRGK
ncbi:hypothetical protein [Lacticaseibacillus mingshuiensis]|uniref:RelA/SpoT domain-containing protein n=1 Tax=Lacticaseibacillus mingshuiensis TaxID=2799574 RepID=A0ABW4CFP2_9LACO|nr:hypothetical protein [Lacticaseibacillus mingshuiensis]